MTAPSLTTLRGLIQQAGVHAEMLRLKHTKPGATSELVDNVARELEHLYCAVSDEIATLERHGEKGA